MYVFMHATVALLSMRCNVFSTLPTLPTLLAAFSPLDALGSWRQLCRSWRQGLQAEITLREVGNRFGLIWVGGLTVSQSEEMLEIEFEGDLQ